MKIFLSHASENQKCIVKLSDFLSSLSSDIEVFCSSDNGSIPIGQNFNKTIFNELNSSDIFIPVISQEYYKSRYCMLELGVAYSYLYTKFKDKSDEYIFPFVVPPLTKSNALSGTPMSTIQVGELNNKSDVHGFINLLKSKYKIILDSSAVKQLHSVIQEIDQIILKNQDIFKLSKILSCCDMSNISEDIKEAEIINHAFTENGATAFFNLNPHEKKNIKRPKFISLVLSYVDGVNLNRYLDFNNLSEFEFMFTNFTNSLQRIFVEFKYSNNHNILQKFEIPLTDGENHIVIPLKEMQSDALGNITEICFVAHPTDVVEDEGSFKIHNIKISKA